MKPETDYSGSARGTPSPGTQAFSARASPKSERSEEEASAGGNKATSENPLAALQMLCDTQTKSPKLHYRTVWCDDISVEFLQVSSNWEVLCNTQS